jgi:hypothetical protein
MKKLFGLLILLYGFIFSFNVQEESGWSSTIYSDQLHPLRDSEEWLNGGDTNYPASKINVINILPEEEFDVYIEAYAPDFPIKEDAQPALYYALYYGYPTSNELEITDRDTDSLIDVPDFNTSQRYRDPGDPADVQKYQRRGRIGTSTKKIIHVKNNTIGNSYLWLSFSWIVKIENTQTAIKQKSAHIDVTIN